MSIFEPIDINKIPEELGIDDSHLAELLNDCYVDLSEKILEPEILISIGQHEFEGEYYPTPVCTAGEFSAITGVSKVKKSFLKSAILGCYIGGDSNILFPNIKSHRKEDFTVLDFDTEQGKYYAQKTFRRVLKMVKANYPHYFCYGTRKKTAKERLLMIDYCLRNQATLYAKPIKFLVVDGIADLTENTNDIVMSKEVADYLLKWTELYNIHIMTIIHKSGITGKLLGHLGTYVMKKAECVFELNLDENKHIHVHNSYSRGNRFDDFTFDVNRNGLPYLID